VSADVGLEELLCDAQPGFASGKNDPTATLQVRMNNVGTDGSLNWRKERRVPATSRQISKYALRCGDVLFNSTNSANLVGKSALYPGHREVVLFSNHFLRLRVNSDRLYPGYLARWLTLQQERGVFESLCMKWVNQAAVRKADLLSLRIPLPSLPEQKRIAAILDKADAVRRKRAEALRLADDFLKSTFLDMFGDPVENPKGGGSRKLSELGGTIRNGLSPSRSGTHPGEVLTLSAITRGSFDGTARRACQFNKTPHPNQFVQKGTFLVCRGNGNIGLVGQGRFPAKISGEVVFPDTMFGIVLPKKDVVPGFFEFLWQSRLVRQWIEASARTTNGAYKINQFVLNETPIMLPPYELQTKFSEISKIVQRLKTDRIAKCSEDLFQSLSQRAFKGKL
jgi:type I restriction enzyme S subunit